MPKKCIKFIPEYLIPSLDNKRFGDRLKWIDKSAKMFEIDWSHKAGPHWSEQEAQVFVEWDKHKGHFNPENKQYFSESKQRFRALLYKFTKEGQLKEMPSKTKFKKVFCIGQKKDRKKKRNIDAEYESNNEEETSELEYEEPGALIHRKISEDEAVNVLEDHSYSASDNFSDVLLYNAENEQANDPWVPISSSESSSDKKRVLVERNYENRAVLGPAIMANFYTENYSSFEDRRDGPDNSTLSLPEGKLPTDFYRPASQNISVPIFSESIFIDGTFVDLEYLESLLNGLHQNYEEEQ